MLSALGNFPKAFVIGIPALLFTTSALLFGAQAPSHRDHFEMNFIGGGEFRQYIMDHVEGEDLWSQTMRVFGTTHNLMHELMSDIARHGAATLGHEDRVPEFATRISGGQWSTYRRNNEAEEDRSDWAKLVQATEVMHDRFHHAMFHATVLDNHLKDRQATVSDYLREDPIPDAQGFPDPLLPKVPIISSGDFRRTVWTDPPETPEWHAAYQQTAVFTEMLTTLMTNWARYAETSLPPDQRPPQFQAQMNSETWNDWVERFPEDGSDEWRYFLQSVALMDHHIHEMLYWMEVSNGTLEHSDTATECCG